MYIYVLVNWSQEVISIYTCSTVVTSLVMHRVALNGSCNSESPGAFHNYCKLCTFRLGLQISTGFPTAKDDVIIAVH